MITARMVLDPAFTVAPVSRRLFGSFVEHMGRCVYGGIYEPGHPLADERGLRADVLGLVRELGVSTVRYPGGNFVSNYRWEDGVGPRDGRPVRTDLAWRSIESNQFGVDDFVDWARLAGVEPMLALNLGTRGVAEAVDLLEYCNGAPGTELADRRVRNGHRDPHAIRLWCLGNEMDGPWQIGHKTAEEYGRLAQEAGKAMKRLDPTIELIACGSSNSGMPTFGEWESTVLGHCFDEVDFVSAHAYYEQHDDDLRSYLASAVDMDRFIEAVVATADAVAARRHSRKRLSISFDEWNVWYQHEFDGEQSLELRRAPAIIEDDFDATDAVVVGGLLISLLKHADRVGAACLAQLVNVIAPIRTGSVASAWRQSIFHPFQMTASAARGTVLRAALECPGMGTQEFGDVPVVDAVASVDDADGHLALFAVNRSPDQPVHLEVALQLLGSPESATVDTIVMGGPRSAGEAPRPRTTHIRVVDRHVALDLAPGSWTRCRLG